MDQLPNIPNRMDGDLFFTVTHPFHPLSGQRFPLLAQRRAWGEWRVFFHDPLTHRVRSLPTAWTDLAPPDPFVILAAGHAILRFTDLQALHRLLSNLQDTESEAGS